MTSQPVIPERLTYAQAAALMGRSVTWLQRKASAGEIPFHKIGHSVRFYREELLTWMDDHQEFDNRVVPVHPLKKKPGQRSVYPSQQLGDFEHCWCGELLDHDWTGKDKGMPHPHDHEGIQQVVVVSNEGFTNDPPHIDKRDLKGYHATLRDFLAKCVNEDGMRFRLARSEVILYPPDDSRPISVYARNNDSQMRSLNQWYQAHTATTVDEATVRKLAEAVNSPEHTVEPVPDIGEALQPEWTPYLRTDGEESDLFETDGTTVRCRECHGTDTAYETPVTMVTGLGGHIRMNHRETDSLRSPEAKEKSVYVRRYNRLEAQVLQAVQMLGSSVGYQPPDQTAMNELIVDRDQWKKRAEELEAKLALMKEAFKGL